MATRTNKPPRVRDLTFAGYEFQSSPIGTVIKRESIDLAAPGDYGADPLGDGTFRMVPSGNVVSYEERTRRLARKNRALSASSKRSPMVSGLTLADYEAMARQQQQRGPTGTLAMEPSRQARQTVAMTPGGTIVMNRARRDPSGWGFVARRGSDSKHVYVSREQAEQIAESPAGTREDYLALWLVPPFYAKKRATAVFWVEHGGLPLAWDYLRGKQELPEDFLNDPNAWLERVKREGREMTWDQSTAPATRGWSARNRADAALTGGSAEFMEGLRSLLDVGDRQVRMRGESLLGGPAHHYEMVHVNFINLPTGIGGAGGGAEAENNRMSFLIEGFHGADPHAPPPRGKVKIEHRVSALPREYKLRGKTGTPQQIARYLADFLNRVAREVPPDFTHTKMGA